MTRRARGIVKTGVMRKFSLRQSLKNGRFDSAIVIGYADSSAPRSGRLVSISATSLDMISGECKRW